MYTGFWWGNLRERDYFEDAGVDWRIILRRLFRKLDVGAWTGSSWLRIGTGERASEQASKQASKQVSKQASK